MTTQDTTRQIVLFPDGGASTTRQGKPERRGRGGKFRNVGITEEQHNQIEACMEDLGLTYKQVGHAIGKTVYAVWSKLHHYENRRFYVDEYGVLMQYFKRVKLARTFGKEDA